MSEKPYRVVHVDPLTPQELEFQRGVAVPLGVQVDAPEAEADEYMDKLKGLLAGANAVVTRRQVFSRDLIAASPRLKMIQKMGRRPDGFDLQAAKERGIAVALMSLPGTVAVAEHVMALILSLARQIPLSHRLTVEGAYRDLGVEPKVTTERSHGFLWLKLNDRMVELSGLTLGIIGFGEIGTEIASRAQAFAMRVVYTSRTRLPEDVETQLNVRYLSQDELLRQSDFISINTPLTPETEKLIGAPQLAMMKPTAFLVNASRGGTIDELALVDALKAKQIAGAGLDVFVQEPVPFDHPYLQLDNVILTPHIAGGKGGARERQPRAVYTNIVNYFEGNPVLYRVA